MSKFKVGDKVKIRDDLIWDHYYGDIRCSSKRLECKGKIGEITKIAKTGSYFVHNHWFSEEMLEACDSKNTSKFKVGDIIRCIKYKDEIVNESLRKAEIIDDTPHFKIKILEHDDPMRVNYRVECIFANLNFDDYFEYFDEEKEPDLTGLHPMTPDEIQRVLEKFGYIDETMDTSKRIVVDSLYPNVVDIKTNENLYDKYKTQMNFYKYIEGIYENEEEKDMNKVLKVWYERKRDKVINEYKEKEVEFYNNKYSVVESFNELVEQFNEDLESLYKMDKVTEQFVLTENAPNNVIKYCLDLDKLKEEFEVEYSTKRNEELKEIEDIRIEVEAQLSLSDDLKYQQEVLERYGIINKKKKIAD